ncbi:MAG TPA: OmpA family protein [Candidatus Acidoferrum sp.]|jgi:outer membrane protein OmpA-like peptidoglycan-associated protein|nr:OmpA family protein [Candidatus Acidoferrum sp.]
MKARTFLPLLLATALALPGLAQQTGQPAASGDQAASGSQSVSTSDRQPIPPPASTNFWDGDDPNLVNLVAHPFANKKYVERRVGPIRDRLNELDQLTSENGRTIKDVDGRAQQGIQLASEKVTLADQHASDAGNKAQMAQTTATQASTRVASVEQMVSSLDQYKGDAQTEIRFRPGQSLLSKSAKDALDQMAAPLKDRRSYIIEVRGFAPGRGAAAIANSRKMADSVVRYLVLNHQIPVYRVYVMSMGNAAAPDADGTMAKNSSGGRVEVSVMKNDVIGSVQH